MSKGGQTPRFQHDDTVAALQARISSDCQVVDISVSAQLRALRDYARKNGYVFAHAPRNPR